MRTHGCIFGNKQAKLTHLAKENVMVVEWMLLDVVLLL